jgi:hypothetical protein
MSYKVLVTLSTFTGKNTKVRTTVYRSEIPVDCATEQIAYLHAASIALESFDGEFSHLEMSLVSPGKPA